jgi:activating signal cointegrator 1
MKAITLHQPWATLVVRGLKRYETRSWNTDYRGPLLIHASSRWDKALQAIARSFPFKHVIDDPDNLPRGWIIGMVQVVRTLRTEEWVRYNPQYADSDEYYFGDFNKGRWAWELGKPILFETPIPAKGALSLWRPGADLMPLIQEQIDLAKAKMP